MQLNFMKCFLFIAFLFSSFSFAQEYTFDTEIQYEYSYFSKNIIIWSNSQNRDYIFRAGGHFNKDEGSIIDFKNQTIHYLRISSSKKKPIKYLYSTSIKGFQDNRSFKIKEIGSIDNDRVVEITFYNDASKKRIFYTTTLTLKKHDTNLFPAFRVACLHPHESLLTLDFKENYIVTKAKSVGNDIRTCALISSVPVNISITVK